MLFIYRNLNILLLFIRLSLKRRRSPDPVTLNRPELVLKSTETIDNIPSLQRSIERHSYYTSPMFYLKSPATSAKNMVRVDASAE
jgi:hypothetical protein